MGEGHHGEVGQPIATALRLHCLAASLQPDAPNHRCRWTNAASVLQMETAEGIGVGHSGTDKLWGIGYAFVRYLCCQMLSVGIQFHAATSLE